MGCGASSAAKKAAGPEQAATKCASSATTAPDPAAPTPSKQVLTETAKLTAEKSKSEDDVPTREPSDQGEQKQEPGTAPVGSAEDSKDSKKESVEEATPEELAGAATKLQSMQRGKQARAEVEKMKEAKQKDAAEPSGSTGGPKENSAEGSKVKTEAVEEATPEELAGAATKLQSMQRGKHARAEVEKMKAANAEGQTMGKTDAELETAAAPKQDSVPAEEAKKEAVEEATPEELAGAATKLQSMQRGKQARAEVDKMKAAKEEGESKTAEAEAKDGGPERAEKPDPAA